MAKTITNEQLYKKLIEVEKVLKLLSSQEKNLELGEHKLQEAEREELELLRRLQGKDIKRRFDNPLQWKQGIWNTCPDKKTIQTRKTIDFECSKTGKSCRFVDCYRNKVG